MNSQKLEIQDLEQQKTWNVIEQTPSIEFDFLSKWKKIVNDTVPEIKKIFKRQKDMWDSL